MTLSQGGGIPSCCFKVKGVDTKSEMSRAANVGHREEGQEACTREAYREDG